MPEKAGKGNRTLDIQLGKRVSLTEYPLETALLRSDRGTEYLRAFRSCRSDRGSVYRRVYRYFAPLRVRHSHETSPVLGELRVAEATGGVFEKV